MCKRENSEIVYIHSKGEYGYISKTNANSPTDYSFKPKDLRGIDISELEQGMKVSFILEKKGEYLNATDIRLIDENLIETHSLIPNESNDKNSQINSSQPSELYLDPQGKIHDSELVIGIVNTVGIDSSNVIKPICDKLKILGYVTKVIKVSQLLGSGTLTEFSPENERIQHYMSQGNKLRDESKNNAILATGVIKKIKELRDGDQKIAYVVDSLKHPAEVICLRKTYGNGFYLIGVHTDEDRRYQYLVETKMCPPNIAHELIRMDASEDIEYGQKSRDTFHLADFFLNLGKNNDQVNNTVYRFLDLVFSHPHRHPTFDEYAMFMAFNSSARSGDLSRQVGAVLSKNQQILATGANDIPKAGGGLYWAYENEKTGEIIDVEGGKDYKLKGDSNKRVQSEMVEAIMKSISEINLVELSSTQKKSLEDILKSSKIGDLTEFGRVVHAEMEAILSCSREGVSTSNATLYCTTFPCHNCAKHIIASGVTRVVYVEPYPKSMALELHSDAIELKKLDVDDISDKVVFESFIGVGPRRFLDLFSMGLGMGTKIKRKDKNGSAVEWSKEKFNIRTPLLKKSYLEFEEEAEYIWNTRFDKTPDNEKY